MRPQKRPGAKATKKLEQLEPVGHELNPKEATVFRALSARANDLAQDRFDLAYISEELCRKFAVPNKRSYNKLKRLVRYLVAIPRLLYHYPWQDKPTGTLENSNVKYLIDNLREMRSTVDLLKAK